jgi:HD-like signal output (HDOD) protein
VRSVTAVFAFFQHIFADGRYFGVNDRAQMDSLDDDEQDIYKQTSVRSQQARRMQQAVPAPAPSAGPSLTFPAAPRRSATNTAAHSSGSDGLAALDFLKMLAGELSTGTVDLPCFPNVVLKIRDALTDPTTTTDAAARLITAEPRLAARLLQTANSAAMNPSGKRITDLKNAITRLGQQIVQGAAMAFAVQQLKDAPTLKVISRPLFDLWRRSIAVASICQVVARRTSVPTDQALLTGLMHGIGRLYIMVRATTKSGNFDPKSELAALVEGWHPSIGKAILENWDMGDELANAVNDQLSVSRKKHAGADLTDILIVAVALAAKLEDPECTVEHASIDSFQSIGLKPEDCDLIVTHASYQLGSLQEALGC